MIHYPDRRFFFAAEDNVEGLYLKVVFEKKSREQEGLKERNGQSKVSKKGFSVHI